MIDLHMHSTASDGSFTPTQLMEKIVKAGLKAAALTDHDVIDGCAEFRQAAEKAKIMALNGSELSADYPKVNIEILALDIPNKSMSVFIEHQKNMIAERFRVAHERLNALAKLGISLEWDEVAVDEQGKKRLQIGKPHVVAAMLKKGYIKTWDEGFENYLNRGCPAYVAKKEPSAKQIIELVRDNGAVPVLAHPIHTKRSGKELVELLKNLRSWGLMGAEVFHSDHSFELRNDYLQMVEALELLASGGSDFHGGAHPGVEIGVGKGDLQIPDIILDAMLERQKVTEAYYRDLAKYV